MTRILSFIHRIYCLPQFTCLSGLDPLPHIVLHSRWTDTLINEMDAERAHTTLTLTRLSTRHFFIAELHLLMLLVLLVQPAIVYATSKSDTHENENST